MSCFHQMVLSRDATFVVVKAVTGFCICSSMIATPGKAAEVIQRRNLCGFYSAADSAVTYWLPVLKVCRRMHTHEFQVLLFELFCKVFGAQVAGCCIGESWGAHCLSKHTGAARSDQGHGLQSGKQSVGHKLCYVAAV